MNHNRRNDQPSHCDQCQDSGGYYQPAENPQYDEPVFCDCEIGQWMERHELDNLTDAADPGEIQ